jgi:lipopolysaccharide transport system ATP-binding protein
MSDIAIRVEQLSKRYKIGGQQSAYKTLRESMIAAMGAPVRWLKGIHNEENTFWALDDVSFEIERGEAVGIIGRNGAGKSTLLKVLSRITRPTCGRVELFGRVGSLLEVGTGFHPELTGRENIYLNGAILGMSRAEIVRKFDEIVDFAEIEKFLDTPVKFYSSGMYVRLAFAVAAHLEPEILVVDEVLAVGDAAFQKKSMGKMGEVARQGRTVLFVSHNMGAIANLCSSGLLLSNGVLAFSGSASQTVSKYLSDLQSSEVVVVFDDNNISDASFTKISILDSHSSPTKTVSVVEAFYAQFEYKVRRPISGMELSFALYDRNGSKIFSCLMSNSKSVKTLDHEPGHYVAKAYFPANFLAPGTYTITPALHQPNIHLFDLKDSAIQISVTETGSADYKYAGQDIGAVLVNFDWSLEKSKV